MALVVPIIGFHLSTRSINTEFENPSDIRRSLRVSEVYSNLPNLKIQVMFDLESIEFCLDSHGVSETNQRVSDTSVSGWLEPVTQPETLFHSSLSFFRCFNAYLLTVSGVLGVLG